MVKRFVAGLVEGVAPGGSSPRWRSLVPSARLALWTASLTGMALCVRSLALGAAPPSAALVVVVACAAFAVVGVLVPQLGMFGDVVSSGKPETHAVGKDGKMYYAFYADQWSGKVELRGLENHRYHVVDYVNQVDYGSVEGPHVSLQVEFTDFLLIEVTPE